MGEREDWSQVLYGGAPRLAIAAAIAKTKEPTFTTAEIVAHSGVPTETVAERLNRWVALDGGRELLLVRDGPKGSGKYRRMNSPFWSGCAAVHDQLTRALRPADIGVARARRS